MKSNKSNRSNVRITEETSNKRYGILPYMLTKKEKESLVIELYKQGKTIREIAKVVHMSFSRISQIINRFEGVNSDEKDLVSKETKALKLFTEEKDPIFVAIELDMKIDEIKRLNLEYLNMKGFGDLTKFYYEQRDQFLPFVQFYNNLRSKGISTLKVIGLAELVDKIPYIEMKFKEKSDNIQGMLQQQQSIAKEIYRLQNIEAALQNSISSLEFVSYDKQQEIQYLSNEIENLKKQNEEMSRGGGYHMTSEKLEWLSNRTGIDLLRLQKIHQNTLRMLSSMRLQ